MRITRFVSALCVCSLAAGTVFAGPGLKDDITGIYETARTTPPASRQQVLTQQVRELFEAHPPASLSVEELNLTVQIASSPLAVEHADAFLERVDSFADAKSSSGAAAAVIRTYFEMYRAQQPPEAEAFAKVLKHPGLGEAIVSGTGSRVFEIAGIMASNLPPYQLGPARSGIDGLAEHVKAGIAPQSAAAALEYADGVALLWEDRPEAIESLEERLVEALRQANETLDDDDMLKPEIEHHLKRLTFVGNEAPGLDFVWSSDGFEAKTLADLRGRVVVLDFWATWCNPCVAAFPDVRELVEHYKDAPVTVIGVTSLQGQHIPRDGNADAIDTSGKPELEYELMQTFMGDHEMTWPVVFTKQSVGNPDYFVVGIPHVTIIAPDGTVRHNGLNPHMVSFEQETEMIDAILKEFGLETPAEG